MAAQSNQISVGLVGAGELGLVIGKQLLSAPGTSVAAIADVDETSARRAARRLGTPLDSVYTDHSEMYASEPLDAVVIATPHCYHYEQIVDALDHGYHVLTEKPLVVDLDHARDIVEAWQESELVVMVGFQRHCDSAFQIGRQHYRGTDREITYARATITENWFGLYEDTWRTDPTYSGGGFITDTGRHIIDALLWTTGLNPVSVTAQMDFHEPGMELEGHLRIEFENGSIGSIAAFGDAASVREEYYICDTDGAIFIEGHGWNEGDRRELEIIDDNWGRRTPYLDRLDELTKGEAFIDAIRRDSQPPATPLDSLRTIAVIQAARESAQTGEPVAVPQLLWESPVSSR